MKILVLADKPPSCSIKEIFEEHTDIALVVTLGDLSYMDLNRLLCYPDIPKIGVYGNHCDGMYMDNIGITNLHLKTFEMNGLVFGGFDGCVQYKPGKFQHSQEEAMEMLRNFPKVDVLICHCPPFGINDDQSDHAHIGFHATKKYLETFHPKYIFHGHTYDYGGFIDKYEDTNIVYVHGGKIIEL